MKILISVFVILALSCSIYAASYKISAPDDLKKYVPDVENTLGSVLDEIIASRKAVIALMGNTDAMTNDISNYLGASEKKYEISKKILYYVNESNIISDTLSDVRLISYESFEKDKMLSKGYVNYLLQKDGKISVAYSAAIYDPVKSKGLLYLPVIISKDGKIMEKEELTVGLAEACGIGSVIPALILNEIVNSGMTEILEIDPPFGRWYTEGMSYKITSLILSKYNKKIAVDFDKLFALSPKSQEVKNKVNLWDYPQIRMMQNLDKIDRDVDTASIQYSCVLANDLVKKIGESGIGKINSELKYSSSLPNEKICKTISDLFKIDFQSMLLEYTPEDVKSIIKSGDTSKFKADIAKNMEEKKWNEAIQILTKVLKADPYNYNFWLNQAVCKRELGNIDGSNKDILVSILVIPEGNATISINEIENNEHAQVVLAKFLFYQMSYTAARNILVPIYEKHPDWTDVKGIIDASDAAIKRLREAAEQKEKREQEIREYQEKMKEEQEKEEQEKKNGEK